MVKIAHKRGDTLVWECEYTDDAGVPVDLTSYSIRCQARNSVGELLFDANESNYINVYNPTLGYFRLTITSTSEWEIGKYTVDVEYTIGTVVKSSDTFNLIVEEDITR